ncbi:MAG: polyamine aminopropyltransferase [Candidatus Omnitrophica bacterium]|nr:polyamine aminopropyltransferase [Candidatus Omnitrophota bacterium]
MKAISAKKEKWFVEAAFPGIRRCKKDTFRVEKEIFAGRTKYQKIYIFESLGFGKMLALDGIIQFSQSDEFIYHEIIAHVPLMTHPDPKRLLVVGGGDGGVLREARKHPLKEMSLVDIDEEVVGMARKYLPFVSQGSFTDKRLTLAFQDGRKFIKAHKNHFDIIVVDSTDPVGPGKALFQGDFYKSVHEALTGNGIAIFQLGPFLDFDIIIKGTVEKLSKLFTYLNPVRLPMPSYSCGCEYCFLMASKKVDPAKLALPVLKRRLQQRLGAKAADLKYYSPEMHLASLVTPKIWRLKKR